MDTESTIVAGGRLDYFVDEIIFFRGALHVTGWAFHSTQSIHEIGWVPAAGEYRPMAGAIGLDSPDVSAQMGERAERSRFRLELPGVETAGSVAASRLVFTLSNGARIESSLLQEIAQSRQGLDPYHRLQQQFFELVCEGAPAGRALEIGSRNRSGNVRRGLFPVATEYIGLDILPGDNVDMVGDAHALSDLFAPLSFDSVLSISVFEHLLMPWKAVLEVNRVMKTGGLLLIATHQTFPLHEIPWDFFRFSDQAWHGLLNHETGFEIIETALGEPASIVPRMLHQVLMGLEGCPAFIGSAVLARKVGNTALEWPVNPKAVISSMYPPETSVVLPT